MPNVDPRDGFFYPTLTLMIDFYIQDRMYWQDRGQNKIHITPLNPKPASPYLLSAPHICQWRSQNVEKNTHIEGRQLYQAMILYNYDPFQNGNFS